VFGWGYNYVCSPELEVIDVIVKKGYKEIIFWGAGQVLHNCLSYSNKPLPSYIIDSNKKESHIYGVPVISPDEIDDWADYYVVITVKNGREIVEFLEKMNLIEGEDFCSYKDYFDLESFKPKEIFEKIETGEILKDGCLIFAPLWTARNSKGVRSFFENFVEGQGFKDFVIIDDGKYISRKEKNEKFPYRTFNIDKASGYEEHEIIEKVNDYEKEWLEELCKRKLRKDNFEDIIYQFGLDKCLLEALQPRVIVYWGGWSVEGYSLQQLAKKNNILFCFAEHGYLKGTIQLDFGGCGAQCQFCQGPYLTTPRKIAPEIAKNTMKPISDYILKGLSQSNQITNLSEVDKINKLDRGKATFLLVGMGDFGMNMNPKSDYWKNVISPVVTGSFDAYKKLRLICDKNGWNLIFKPHPLELPNQEKVKIEESENVKLVYDLSIEYLISSADVVVSISSAVDYEVLLMGKPLVQLGNNSLVTANCSYVAFEENEIEKQMVSAIKYGLSENQKINYDIHMTMLLETTHWDDMTERDVRYGIPPKKSIFDVYNGV
jgi:hypothetical protein